LKAFNALGNYDFVSKCLFSVFRYQAKHDYQILGGKLLAALEPLEYALRLLLRRRLLHPAPYLHLLLPEPEDDLVEVVHLAHELHVLPGFIDTHREDAVRILDFSHAAEYVAAAGQAVLGDGTPQFHAWLNDTLHELKHGQPETVLQTLRDLQAEACTSGSGSAAAVETIQKSLTYLEKRRDHLHYAEFQALGYPIGSGSVESANKLVVEARMKKLAEFGESFSEITHIIWIVEDRILQNPCVCSSRTIGCLESRITYKPCDV
jgi:hypothetical protein